MLRFDAAQEGRRMCRRRCGIRGQGHGIADLCRRSELSERMTACRQSSLGVTSCAEARTVLPLHFSALSATLSRCSVAQALTLLGNLDLLCSDESLQAAAGILSCSSLGLDVFGACERLKPRINLESVRPAMDMHSEREGFSSRYLKPQALEQTSTLCN